MEMRELDVSSVWIISDGKQGHYNQSLGLALALQRQGSDLTIETLSVLTPFERVKLLLGAALPQQLAALSKPSLIISAGHATHLSLLILGWRLKAKTLLLMKPSLPLTWFDLCLIPAHDQPKLGEHVEITQGALNPMRPATKQAGTGLVLIGGPSKHHGWDESALFRQLEHLIVDESRPWTITSSRRTPAMTLAKLGQLPNVSFIPHTETPQGWLAEKLSTTEVAWVTADSVSMIYESLTAGCRVGVLEVPEVKVNRLTRGIQALAQEGTITLFSQWTQTKELSSMGIFNEADRCADVILKRGWL